MKKPRILITNDDGIFAPGIWHLWNAIKDFAEITVVAPAVEQSASGLSITVRDPLRIERINWSDSSANAWAVGGTPSDCVKLALNVILQEPPHLILSGVNRGTNAGRNVLYSGTVAGVIEGVFHDIPGIAFSLGETTTPDFGALEKYILQIMNYAIKHPLPPGTFLNVNFPEKQQNPIEGIRMTSQGKEYWIEDPESRSHPSGHTYYWLGAKLAQFKEEDNSDITWLRKGYVTVAPIHVGELTDYGHIKSHKQIFEDFVNEKD
jgi:5'-nucleotidase